MLAYLFVFGIFLIISLVLFGPMLFYKMRAEKLGLDISWGQVFGQQIRKTMTKDIIDAAAIAKREGFNVTIRELETHKLSGGSPSAVIEEMIEFKRLGKKIDFKIASSFDLFGADLKREWLKHNMK